ncbi:MAG: 23S rRNA (adenine(2503)-C(2))-methyltransferase RlmN [Bacteroidales bacterium]
MENQAIRPDLAEMELADLERFLAERTEDRFRARQVFAWVYKRGVGDFDHMSDLSKALRSTLQSDLVLRTPQVAERHESTDGTTKFALELADHRRIESVFIPDSPGNTLCISSQVGCAMGCAFCLTGKMGLVRNLTAGEIVGQVRVLTHALGLLGTSFNIVLMGMGEPLHNYDETMKALRILCDPSGFAVPPRRVTLSTVGVVPALDRLATEPLMPNLAVSLHATTEEQRSRLVPLNRKYRIEDVLAACRRFPVRRRDRITFEYVLLDGVNDDVADARRLVKLLDGLRAKVNLIPLNEAAGIDFTRPSDERIDRFAKVLADHRITVSVRKSRGRDIRAACGQLIVEGQKRSPAQKLAAALP